MPAASGPRSWETGAMATYRDKSPNKRPKHVAAFDLSADL
jgi:hypothetical protein